eukprot:m.63499 g.63499  ORF g.63499 m.63499 type:complete len:79 (+) comp15839_c0_seq9:171-407(+)
MPPAAGRNRGLDSIPLHLVNVSTEHTGRQHKYHTDGNASRTTLSSMCQAVANNEHTDDASNTPHGRQQNAKMVKIGVT